MQNVPKVFMFISINVCYDLQKRNISIFDRLRGVYLWDRIRC